VWGQALYDPESRTNSQGAEKALESASRILPMITSTHGPSAANNTYWPEMYTAQPMVDPRKNNPYTDTPSPKTFGNASPFDPQMFSTVNGFADELVKGEGAGKYSPVEVAQWLEDLAQAAATQLAQTAAQKTAQKTPQFRRIAIDIGIQAALGRFFAARFRSGVLYGIHERNGDRAALEEALKMYRHARDIWAQMAESARGVYVSDLTVGELPWLRGHWLDRLPAIDSDIADMAAKLENVAPAPNQAGAKAAIAAALGRPSRGVLNCSHKPAAFRRAAALPIDLTAPATVSARLWYRHLDQAERFEVVDLARQGIVHRAAIPPGYTDSPFPLQYYFEVRQGPEQVWLYPGFDANRANQPYFLVRPA
jgi:hypothetical protein